MKKVCFILANLDSGGIERVAASLIEKLNLFYDLQIINLYGKTNKFNIKGKIYSLNNKNIKNKYVRTLYIIYQYLRLIKKLKINIILSFGDYANIYNLLTPISSNKKILSVHSIKSIENKEIGKNGNIFNFFIKNFYKYSRKIIVVSESSKIDLIRNYKLNVNKLILIENPYNIYKIIEQSKEKTELNFSEKYFHICSVGRMVKLKGFDKAIKILSFSKYKKNIKYYLIGNGEYLENLKVITKKYDMENNVIFLGNQPNPFKYLKNMDLFLSLSDFESFPGVLIEALACAVPILATESTSSIKRILNLSENENINEYGIVVEKFTYNQKENLNKSEEKVLNYIENIYKKEIEFTSKNNFLQQALKFDIENTYKKYINIIGK